MKESRSFSLRRALRASARGALVFGVGLSTLSPAYAQPRSATAARVAAGPGRVERLIGALSEEEAIDLLGGVGFATHPATRLGIPSFDTSDGPSGLRWPTPSNAYAGGIALAASWDVTLADHVGEQLGRDARARGSEFLLGPGANLYRAPMNGRNFEYFGEDPWLASRLAVAYVQGVQRQGVSATIKHFVGNDSEYARRTSDSAIDERALRELYLPAFEAAVKEAKVGAVMCGYNLTNGEHMSQNGYLATEVLKKQWGFDGVYMSDWDATHDGVAAANAGLDLEMPTAKFMTRSNLVPALRDGRVSREVIDDKLRRLLGLAERFGWLDRSSPDVSISRYNQAGREVARQGALEGMVLLQNEGNLLPLDPERSKSIAVIGPLAHPGEPTAGGSGKVTTFQNVSFLRGISEALGSKATVTYHPGLPPLRALGMRTPFMTRRVGGEPGLLVEELADGKFEGAPLATRVEWTLSRSSSVPGEADWLMVREYLPLAQQQVLRDARQRNVRDTRYERWTGWFTPERAGDHTLFLHDTGPYRVKLDGKVVIDSTRIPKAALRQVHLSLSAQPHELVLEQSLGREGRLPTFRGGIVRDDDVVDPVAKALAAKADVVVVAVGFDSEIELESADREFALPPGQDRLIRELAKVNPRVVVVLTSGGSVDVSGWRSSVPALIAAWYPGQEGGAALADVLLGKATPSGRLPISWERAAEQNPTHDSYYYNDPAHPDRIVYREGVFAGYRGYQQRGTAVAYPFGFGLSYTTFRYSNLAIAAAPTTAGPRAPLYDVSFDLTNTGRRPGADVAQLYVTPAPSKVPRPKRELKGFARVELAPGETRRVKIALPARAFAYYDVSAKRWQADAGKYGIELARSAEDTQAKGEVVLPAALTIPVSE
jgi:beta-glucosidase